MTNQSKLRGQFKSPQEIGYYRLNLGLHFASFLPDIEMSRFIIEYEVDAHESVGLGKIGVEDEVNYLDVRFRNFF